VQRLHGYVKQRDKDHPHPSVPSFFLSGRGDRLITNTVEQTFVRISNQIGLRSVSDSTGPRIHDLRHTFAVKTLVRWYRAGLPVDSMLPLLSTYLGHVKVSDTYWYLSAVPELLHLANTRLTRFLEDQP
jgi:integrase/recombinase XerD